MEKPDITLPYVRTYRREFQSIGNWCLIRFTWDGANFNFHWDWKIKGTDRAAVDPEFSLWRLECLQHYVHQAGPAFASAMAVIFMHDAMVKLENALANPNDLGNLAL